MLLLTTCILSRKLDTANKYYGSAFALDGKELILMVSDKADVIKKIFLHAPSRRTFVSSKLTSAADDPSVSQSVFTIAEKAPTRAFFWLKVPTRTFTFKTHSPARPSCS